MSPVPGANNTKRLKWILVIVLTVFAALVGASAIVYHLLHTGRMHPLVMLIMAAVIAIAVPMIRSNFFPTRKDCESEYGFHEQRLEKELTTRIIEGLGQEAYGQLISPFGQYQASASDNIQTMLTSNQNTHETELRFALLLMLARYHEKSGDPQAGIRVLKTALEIKPHHFIARMHLAGNLEWIGDKTAAEREYRKLLEEPEDLSRAMRKLVAARLKANLPT